MLCGEWLVADCAALMSLIVDKHFFHKLCRFAQHLLVSAFILLAEPKSLYSAWSVSSYIVPLAVAVLQLSIGYCRITHSCLLAAVLHTAIGYKCGLPTTPGNHIIPISFAQLHQHCNAVVSMYATGYSNAFFSP